MVVLLLLLSNVEARDSRKGWVKEAEATYSAPPTVPGGLVVGTRTFRVSQDGRQGCWGEAMYPGVETHSGVDLVDEGIVVASGWEMATGGFQDEEPPDLASLLADKGVSLGPVLGHLPTHRGATERDTFRGGTMLEAGPHRVVWLSHERTVASVLWYDGDQPPEALTRCLSPWEPQLARFESALAAGDCGPIIEDLWASASGTPAPGSRDLLARCDAQWRDRLSALTEDSDPEEVLSVKWYHVVRWDPDRHPKLFADPPSSFARLAPLVDRALDRGDQTPSQEVLFPLLRRALAGETAADHMVKLEGAITGYLPRIAGLAALGVDETALQAWNPLFAPRETWQTSQVRLAPLAKGPEVWSVGDVQDRSTSTLRFDGEGSLTEWTSGGPTSAHQAYSAWMAREAELEGQVIASEWREGDCRYVVPTQTTTRYETYSTYNVITTTTRYGEDVWWCPPEVTAARVALSEHRSRQPPSPSPQIIEESKSLGRRRETTLRPDIAFTIGSDDTRWALSGLLQSHLIELGGGAADSFPNRHYARVPMRPSPDCEMDGAPPGFQPFLGTWGGDRFSIRFCVVDGAIDIDVMSHPENNFAKGSTYSHFGEDGSIVVAAAWFSSQPFFRIQCRRDGENLIISATDLDKQHESGTVLRPGKVLLPFTDLVTHANYSDVAFRDDVIAKELSAARGMLAESLIRERPEIGEAYRAAVHDHLTSTLSGDELARVLFILGYPAEESVPPSVRLLDAWDRHTVEGRKPEGRTWMPWLR